jgi:hypothetical protein
MRWFVEQLLDTGATVTALPPAVLAALAKDAVLRRPACRLRRLGAVWAAAEIAEQPPAFDGVAPLMFDLYPLGDLASLVLRRETRLEPAAIPLGPIRLEEDGGDAVFVETRLGDRRDHEGYAELLLRGPVVPRAPAGPLAANQAGFVATGLRAAPGGGAHGASLQIKTFAAMAAWPSPSANWTSFIGASPVSSMPPASCCGPYHRDRVFAAVMPRPGEPASLEALNRFLAERGVAPYKFPDRLLVVKEIPRNTQGRVLREEILRQI